MSCSAEAAVADSESGERFSGRTTRTKAGAADRSAAVGVGAVDTPSRPHPDPAGGDHGPDHPGEKSSLRT